MKLYQNRVILNCVLLPYYVGLFIRDLKDNLTDVRANVPF